MARTPKLGRLVVRRARPSDAPAIGRIYNEAVRTTTATFDTRPRSVRATRRWLAHHGRRHPVLVAERDRAVVAWASLSPWSDRPAYDRTVEESVYVSAAHRGRGIGTVLLARLLRAGRAAGHHTVLARVVEGNAASRRVHERAGFVSVGVMREVGTKFGRRLDVRLLQLVYGVPVRRPAGGPPRRRGRTGIK